MKAIKVLKTLKSGNVFYDPGVYSENVSQVLLDELEAGSEFVEEIKIQKSTFVQEDSPKQSEPAADSPEPEIKPEPKPIPKKVKVVVKKTKTPKRLAKIKKALKKGK